MRESSNRRSELLLRVRHVVGLGALALLVVSVSVTCMKSAPAGADVQAPEPIASAQPPTSPPPAQAKPCPNRRATPKVPTMLGGTVNLNTASESQLLLLPGVGPSKARRILRWRARHRRFRRTRDIRRVKGFGYKTFKRLRRYLTVAGPNTLSRQPLAPRAPVRSDPPSQNGRPTKRD